jgi:hypothetical protein
VIYEKFDVEPAAISEDSLWAILEEMLRAPIFGTIYCIVDALDECQDEASRHRLLAFLERLVQSASTRKRNSPVLKALIISRPTVELSRGLDQCPSIHLKANPHDLEAFIRRQIGKLQLDANLQGDAIKLLTGRAEQTFLWISIVLKKLKDATTLLSQADMERIISESPSDLTALYEGIVSQIMHSGDVAQQKLLVWVVYGRRALTLLELQEALSIQDDSDSVESTRKHRIRLTENAVTNAAGVILEISDERVYLIHQSAKDFLLRSGHLATAEFCRGLHPAAYLAKVCMVYLCFKDFETGLCRDRVKLDERNQQHPFLRYAARNWHRHIQIEDDINSFASFIRRMTEPGSLTLLAWGEAAGIPDLDKAANIWDVATKAHIPWLPELSEFEPRDTVVDEDRIKAAAKSGVAGYDALNALVRRGNVLFTDEAAKAVARHFDQEMMRLFLEKNGGIMATPALMMAAAANKKYGTSVMRLLLEGQGNFAITDDLAAVVAENDESGKDITELLLRESASVSDKAFAAIVRGFGVEMIRLLLSVREDFSITEDVVKAAIIHREREEAMTLLLEQRGNEIGITDELVLLLVGRFETQVTRLLLEKRGGEVKITEDVVKAAAGNSRRGEAVMALLLEKRGNEVKITKDVIKAAVGNNECGEAIMALLLEKRGNEVKITEDVIKAAAGNNERGETIMALFLEKRGNEIKITEDVIKAAAGNEESGKAIMALLLEKRGDEIKITENVVKIAAGNSRRGEAVIALLLKKRGDEIEITEDVVKIAAGNGGRGKAVMALLLEKRGGEVKITEDVVKAAAKNFWNGDTVMALLLKKRGDEVEITEDVVKVAAGNGGRGKAVMALLLEKRGGEVKITEDVVKAAVENILSGEAVITLLLEKRGDEIKITEDVVKAAVRSHEKVMALLKKRGDGVEITEDMAKAGVKYFSSGEAVITLLLKKRGDEVKITENVVKAAAGNI